MKSIGRGIAVCLLLTTVGCGGGSSAPDLNTSFSIFGSLSGLKAGSTLTLLSNTVTETAWQVTTLKDNGAFTLSMPVRANGSYAVTVGSQPLGQNCTVVNNSGAGITSNVTNLQVQCSDNPYKIGGTVSGLRTGASVSFLNNGVDLTTVSQNGTFTFAVPVAQNGNYAVTLASQPLNQVCTVNAGSGSGVTGDVKDVAIRCSGASYYVSGSVLGLKSGEQITLLNNSGDGLLVTGGDGQFRFKTPISSGSTYSVTIASQPTGQTCTVNNGTGTGVMADVTSLSVICSSTTLSISGSVSGLGSGSQVTLNNGGESINVQRDGAFAFKVPIAFNSSYQVTVGTQPVGQLCTVSNGSGSGVVVDVSTVLVRCSAGFTLSGTVEGLAPGNQLQLLNEGRKALDVFSDGRFALPDRIPFEGNYAVTIGKQPTNQTCEVFNGTGSRVLADVSFVRISCKNNLTGLTGAGGG